MRRFNFGISCLAIASVFFAASSCSDDLEEDSQKTTTTSDDQAYIRVSIRDVEDTRAASDGKFEYGTAAERAIKSADFYFFYSDGTFASHSEATLTGTALGENASTENRIEWKDTAAVIVPDYDVTNPPAYVVTILNKPSTLGTSVKDFDALSKAIAQIPENAETKSILDPANLAYTYKQGTTSEKGFIMTTSSYYNPNAADGRKEFGVTYLNEDMFYTSEAAALEGTIVANIYVERLAAKVRVKMNSGLTTLTVGDKTLYQIGTGVQHIGDEGKNIDRTLYAEITGWGINGQPTASYLIKQIDTTWNYTKLGFEWNETANHRSFWAKSYNYGLYGATSGMNFKYLPCYEDEYALETRATESVDEVSDNTEATAGNAIENHLVYLPDSLLNNVIGDKGVGYCPENTNTGDILNKVENYQGAVTCVLIRANLVDSVGTKQPVVLYKNQLYTYNGFKSLILNAAGYDLVDQDESGEVFDISDVEFVDNDYLNGHIDVALNKKAADITWKDKTTGEIVSKDEINATLKKYTMNDAAVDYKDGMMYYSVPIEHLRGDAPSKTDIINAETRDIKEGQFGVVRNHIYDLTVTEIANLGHGVHNFGEPIVPPLEKDAKYYLRAQVNILSWKVVSQSVNL